MTPAESAPDRAGRSLRMWYRMKWLLFWTYFTRALAVAVYLAAPGAKEQGAREAS